MTNFQVAIDKLNVAGLTLKEMATTCVDSVVPAVSTAADGCDWPVALMAVESVVKDSQQTATETLTRLAEGVRTTGQGLVDVAAAYGTLEGVR